jgi:HK97 family phage prohead protease
METKDFKLELKSVDETGVFEGRLAVYNNVDEQGDVIEPGAFTRTLRDGGGSVVLLWAHQMAEPIGTLTLTDSPTALLARGKLVLSVARAREIYDLMRAGVVKGLSIGFKTIKEIPAGEIRRLKELRLFEGSLTPLPANGLAVVTSVKQQEPDPGPDLEMLDAFKNAARDLSDFHRRMIDGE